METPTWKHRGKALLFPPLVLMVGLVPVAAALLIFAMAALGTDHPVSYAAYVLSAYTLTIWCVRIPQLVRAVQTFKQKNRFAKRLSEDVRLRVILTLTGSLVWNAAYAALQLILGITQRSPWYCSVAVYYVSLAVMRIFLWRHTRRHTAGERMHAELLRYRRCGWVFLVMNLGLTGMTILMVFENYTFEYGMIVTIAMAAYTFTALTVAIVNVVRYRKYHSPVYSASKIISLAAACVSMLTLTSTMLTTFDDGTTDAAFRPLMLILLGVAVSAFVITMAICMILRGNRQLQKLRHSEVPTHEP